MQSVPLSVSTTAPSGATPDSLPFPYDIRFVDTDTSPSVQAQIEEHLTRLVHFYNRITYARVLVRMPHKHGGNRYFHVHVQLDVPGRRLAVSREPEANEAHLDIRIAIRDAFQKITRQLEDFAKSRKG